MFIALLGLPGSGKTTITNKLSHALNGRAFCEPDRSEWPDFITTGFLDNAFDVLSWFRCHQVDLIRNAKLYSQEGIAICDAYYQKTMQYCLRDENSSWIIDKQDPYFNTFEQMSKVDAKILPNADMVIFLHVQEPIWRQLLLSRSLQADDILLEHAFPSQKAILRAAQKHTTKHKIPLHIVEQEFGKVNGIVQECEKLIKGLKHD